MFGSKRSLFSAERGSTTSWLAGITSVALLIGTVALPAVAAEDPSAEPIAVEQSETPAAEVPTESTPAEEATPADEATPAEEPAADEAAIADAVEDESPAAEESAASSNDSASDAPAAPAADKPAPAAADEPAKEESSAPAQSTPSASSSDGTTPDNNGPPVEEFVPGIKVVAGDGEATVYWPDFGAEQNYVVQVEKADGTWKTLDAEVETATRPVSEGSSTEVAVSYLTNVATIDDLRNGKKYEVRIVSAADAAAAEDATLPAVDDSVNGPGKGAAVRANARSIVGDTVITTQSITVQPGWAPTDPNPNLIQKCGLNVALVLDASGSIQTSGGTDGMRAGAKAFVNGVKGTGSWVSLVRFNTSATKMKDATLIDAAAATDFNNAIDGINPANWTNWQDGLSKGKDTFVGFPNSKPDLVVVITDGNPNTFGISPPTPSGNNAGSDGANAAVNPAIALANQVKALGVHMFVIGVGSSITENPIKAISGPDVYNGTNFDSADFVKTPNYATLEATVKEIVNSQCSSLDKTTETISPVAPGQEIDYTVTLTSKVPANGPTITSDLVDVLPDGVTFVSGSATRDGNAAVPDSVVGQTVTWSDVAVAPGVTTVFAYKVTVDAGVANATPLQNLATWNSLDDFVDLTVGNPGTPGLTKVADKSVVEDGGVVEYTLTLTNTGGAPVTSDLVDVLADGTTFKAATGATVAPTSVVGQKVTWEDVTVDAGDTFVATYTVDVATGLVDGAELINDASWAELKRAVTVTVDNPGVPGLEKASDPVDGAAVQKGDTIAYTVTVSNTGGAAITEDLTDTLPDGVALDEGTVQRDGVDVADADFDLAGNVLTFYDVTVAANSSTDFTYDVGVTAGFGSEDLVNTARWPIGENEYIERATEHPVKAIEAEVTSFCVKDAPFYSLTITPQNGSLFSDQKATVSWYQANDAGQPIDAEGNPTTDPSKFVPAYNPANGVAYVDEYSLTDGALSIPQTLWKGAAVDGDGNATAWPGWILNADGSWTQVDSGGVRPGMFAVVTVNPTATTSVVYPPAAAPCANPPGVPTLDKTSNPTDGTDVAPGDDIEYTVTVTNTGGSTFTGPMVDTLPSGFTVDEASVTASGGELNGNKITWQVTLGVGEVKTFTYSGTVDSDAEGDLVNNVVLTLEDGSTIKDKTTHPVVPVSPIEDEEDATVSDAEDLAATGANNVGTLVGAALLAMLAGGLMVTFGRRRREE